MRSHACWAILLVLAVGSAACASAQAARPKPPAVDATAGPAVIALRPGELPPPMFPAQSWMAALDPAMAGATRQISCFDANGDARLNIADSPLLAGLDIPLRGPDVCLPPVPRRAGEWFVADDVDRLSCDDPDARPLLIVAIGGGGSDLYDRDEGVSVGLIDITNAIRAQFAAAATPASVILMTAAIRFSDHPQTRMEQWLASDLARRLDGLPCLGVVLMGHSHGAVVVTSVLASLESRYGARLYGVTLDRSVLYYDRSATEMPLRAPLLNVYQVNEGWHGEWIGTANVTNVDASGEFAPREPRDGPLPLVAVAHSTLDDAIGVRAVVVAAVTEWAAAR